MLIMVGKGKNIKREVRPVKISNPVSCQKCGSTALWHIGEFLCPNCGWTDYQEPINVVTSIKDFNELLASRNPKHIGKAYAILNKFENLLRVKKIYITQNTSKNFRNKHSGDWHKKYLSDVPSIMVLCPDCHKNIKDDTKFEWTLIDYKHRKERIMPFSYTAKCIVRGCKIEIKLVHYRAKAFLWWEIHGTDTYIHNTN